MDVTYDKLTGKTVSRFGPRHVEFTDGSAMRLEDRWRYSGPSVRIPGSEYVAWVWLDGKEGE